MAIEARDWSPCAASMEMMSMVPGGLVHRVASSGRELGGRHEQSGIGILQLKRRFLDGVRRIDRGKDGTEGARPRGKTTAYSGTLGAQNRDDVALSHAARQPAATARI